MLGARALIYKRYLLAGLRRSEFASLPVGQLKFDGPVPFAVFDASDDRNRRGADIPLWASGNHGSMIVLLAVNWKSEQQEQKHQRAAVRFSGV